MPRVLATCLATLAACALLPGAAGASVSLSSVSLQPSTTQAGGHPDVTIDTVFGLNPATDDVKSVRVVLPQGLVGNPHAADACSETSFMADACPAGSKIGTTTASAVVTVPPGVDVPQDVPGDVYSLKPHGSEPARLGVVLRPNAVNLVSLPKVFLESPITSDASTNYGLSSTFDNLPRTSGPFDIRLTAMKLTLAGSAAHGPFVTNPTGCGPATMTSSVTSYDQPTVVVSRQASFTPTGCSKLPFAPKLTGTIGGRGQTGLGVSPALTTTVSVGAGQANPRRIQVTLPTSTAANSAHSACSASDLAHDTCPAASVVGSATAVSPLLPAPLRGPVILAFSDTGLADLVIELKGAVPVTLVGKVNLLGGQLSNVFDGIPDVPLSTFVLSIKGGPGGLLVNSADLCAPGAATTAAGSFLAHSGASVKTNARLRPVGCPKAGKPKASVKLRFRGGEGTLTAGFKAGRGAPAIRSARVKLPANVAERFNGRELKRHLKAFAGKHKLAVKTLRLRGRTLDVVPKGSNVRSLVVRLGGLEARGALAKRLSRRPALVFTGRIVDTAGRATSFRLLMRPTLS